MLDKKFSRTRDFLKILIYVLVFFIPIIIVPYLALFHSPILYFDFNQFKQNMPLLLIVAMGYITIFLGTSFYGILLYLDIRHSRSDENKLDWFFIPSILILLGSLVLIIFGFFDVIGSNDIHKKVDNAEWYSIAIFICLLAIDIATYFAKWYQISNNITNNSVIRNLEHIGEKKFIVNQMFLIDIPVIAGILLVSKFAHSIDTSLFETETLKKNFIENFTVGAIAMHIVYSQFVFVVLNIGKILNDFREKTNPSIVPLWIYICLFILITVPVGFSFLR